MFSRGRTGSVAERAPRHAGVFTGVFRRTGHSRARRGRRSARQCAERMPARERLPAGIAGATRGHGLRPPRDEQLLITSTGRRRARKVFNLCDAS
ncbi:hypothetical protein HPB50_001910 [Hyalomma asiaticum]|uniref:Uncharacterized protein n=1 Tax=Hyalomma asiaticum TaxID=266040 RepID=A0ACB7TGY1_HYAAI|nr:hypothetical protein HPB50_001910 [Hyalomma asiaticum]